MRTDQPLLDDFRKELRASGLSDVAVSHYAGVVRRGIAAGDMLVALREACSPSAAKIARAGLLRWARWHKDRKLETSLPSVPYLPAKSVKLRCTPEMLRRLEEHRNCLPAPQRLVVEVALQSTERIINLLSSLPRRRILGMRDLLDATRRELRLHRGWEHLGDLLAKTPDAAYAAYRRAILVLCKAAGIGPLRPNDITRLVRRQRALDEEESGT